MTSTELLQGFCLLSHLQLLDTDLAYYYADQWVESTIHGYRLSVGQVLVSDIDSQLRLDPHKERHLFAAVAARSRYCTVGRSSIEAILIQLFVR